MKHVSLDGIEGKEGRGLTVVSTTGTTNWMVTEAVAAENPRRAWLLCSNAGSFKFRIKPQGSEGSAATYHDVLPGGSLLINKDMPFTGVIKIVGDVSGDSTYVLTEASVQ